MGSWQIIHTDNLGSDYPDEQLVQGLPHMNQHKANLLADIINSLQEENPARFYKAVPAGYTLQPGFEP